MPTDLEGLWEKLALKSIVYRGGVGSGLNCWEVERAIPIITQWVTEHDAELMAENEKWLEAAFQAERNALAREVVQHDAVIVENERLRKINSEGVTAHNALLVEICRTREALDVMVRRDLADLEASR